MFTQVWISSLWQRLDEWDKTLFYKINTQWINPLADNILPWFRDPVIWAPIYIFLLAFIVLNYGKKGLWWTLAFICTIAIADLIGARVFKDGIQRLRPCQDPLIMDHVRLLVQRCSGGPSFVSNHAANHFGIATFAFLTFRGIIQKWMYVAFIWAIAIAYAQVYVGVHYPLDVLGGAVLGILSGSFTAWIFHKKWGTFTLDNQKT